MDQTNNLVLWDPWDDLWKCRNFKEHEDSITDQHAIAQGCYSKNSKTFTPNYVPSDPKFLMSNYHAHAEKSYSSISSWLAFYRPIFKHSRIRAVRNSITKVRSLSDYFLTTLPAAGPRRQEASLYSYSSHPTPPPVPLQTANLPP